MTYNRKQTAELLGVSVATVDGLIMKGELTKLPAFEGARYSIDEIERIAGCKHKKTFREKELEKMIQEKDKRIEELTRYILDNGIIAR